jgi:hypothetical protein
MILFATGLENIRDVIPFPRYPGRADLWYFELITKIGTAIPLLK